MDLKDIYARCGLKDPKDFAIEVRTNSLFMDQSYAKSILEYGRGLGKTTNFMMMGIQNLFISTVRRLSRKISFLILADPLFA